MAFDRLEQLMIANSSSDNAPEALTELGTPSTSIAILNAGNVTSKCYSTVHDNESTIFQACSISKPIAALAIMRLIEDGYFALDSTIADLLPAGALSILTEGSPESQKAIVRGITVRQLMSHTAGLSVGGFDGYPSLNELPTGAEIIHGQTPINNMRVRLELPPGFAFSYSGGGITVLQIILETVTKKPFPELMQDLVLKPLKMNRSFYGPVPKGEDNAASAYETGFTPCIVPHHVLPELAAAGLWTTPSDLLKAVQAVQRSLEADDFLRKITAQEMLTKQLDPIGLSWFISKDYTNFSHLGSNEPGYRCAFGGFAQLKQRQVPDFCGYAIMTNSKEGNVVREKIMQAISYLNGWPQLGDLDGGIQTTPFWDDQAESGNKWREFRGQWQGDNKEVTLEEDDGEPVVYFGGIGPIRLLPAATPAAKNEAGDCVRFVVEGMKLLLRLEDDGEKQLVIENGARREACHLRHTVG